MKDLILLRMNDISLKLFKALFNKYKKMELGITPAQSRILMEIYSSDKLFCQKDIENVVPSNKSTLSEILNIMEKNDLIIRTGSKEDSRRKNITLTKKGIKIAKTLENGNKEISKTLCSNITKEEYTIFSEILDKIEKNMERL